jgi:hypothetical protein
MEMPIGIAKAPHVKIERVMELNGVVPLVE